MHRPQSPWSKIEVWELSHSGMRHGPYEVPGSSAPEMLPVKKELFSHWFYACHKVE